MTEPAMIENVNTHVSDDGTGGFVNIAFHKGVAPAYFWMELPHIGKLIGQLNMLCRQMINRMNETGAISKYRETTSGFEPSQVLSLAMAPAEDGSYLVLNIQTTDGPFFEFQLPTLEAQKLAAKILSVKPGRSAKPSDKLPSVN
jgi:hypothetical protein